MAVAAKSSPAVREPVIRPVFRVIRGSRPDPDGPDPASGGDAALARALARGEPAAMRAFVADTLPRISGVARRLMRDEAEAEDVAQETYLRVWKNAGDWEPGRARLESWAVRIAINLCYDRLRKRRETHFAEPPERADTGQGAESALIAGDSARHVRAAVAALPERQRLALELCHFQELGNIEAAGIMEISVEALESLLARGRRKLKAELAASVPALMDGFAPHSGEER